MKEKEHAAAEAIKKKEENKMERECRAKERLEEKNRKKVEQDRKRLEREKQKERKSKEKRCRKPKNSKPASTRRPVSPTLALDSLFSQLGIEEDNGQCSNCSMSFKDEPSDDRFWVCCDRCDGWYCFSCHKFTAVHTVPDEYVCSKCV